MCYQRHQNNAPFSNNGGLLITSGCQVRRHSKGKRAKEGAPATKQLMDFVNSAPGGGGSRTAPGPSADGPGGRGQLDHSTVPDGRTLQSTLIFYKIKTSKNRPSLIWHCRLSKGQLISKCHLVSTKIPTKKNFLSL